jgi:hypothetical protein
MPTVLGIFVMAHRKYIGNARKQGFHCQKATLPLQERGMIVKLRYFGKHRSQDGHLQNNCDSVIEWRKAVNDVKALQSKHECKSLRFPVTNPVDQVNKGP